MYEYKIEIPHFYCLDYYENGRVMKIDVDFRDKIIFLNIDLIHKWLSPYEDENITLNDKKRILNNIYIELLKNNSHDRIKLE